MCEEYHPEQLLELVTDHLRAIGMRFGRTPDAMVMFGVCGNRHGTYPSIIDVHPRRPMVMFLAIMGTHVPAEKRPVMAELLTRINHNLMFGNFEMDFADGEIRFRTSVDVAGGELASEMLETLIHANLQTADRFHPAIASLLWNDLSPEEALAMIEGQT